eukprot:TRINITY_DN6886_c0_g1_i2.p1 TRINITY_DN6886_c0_g1~~TRINITY_DN6886_c0_g1_i2.p1  ORF type:complete len:370 (+),score=55.55 TRINITY_DN6886_c0_g1_i2:112-1221(+)
MRTVANAQAQEAASRLLTASIADAASRAAASAVGGAATRHRSMPAQTGSAPRTRPGSASREGAPSPTLSAGAELLLRRSTQATSSPSLPPPQRPPVQAPPSVPRRTTPGSTIPGLSAGELLAEAAAAVAASAAGSPLGRLPLRGLQAPAAHAEAELVEDIGDEDAFIRHDVDGAAAAPVGRIDGLSARAAARLGLLSVSRVTTPRPRPRAASDVTEGSTAVTTSRSSVVQPNEGCYKSGKPPDSLDFFQVKEELRQAHNRIARLAAAPEVLSTLDLPRLAALRSELVASHAEALERIDDRRVWLQAQQSKTQEGPERGRCVACWVRKADHLLLPCRHLCICGTCLDACKNQCPICRGTVSNSIEVYGVN